MDGKVALVSSATRVVGKTIATAPRAGRRANVAITAK